MPKRPRSHQLEDLSLNRLHGAFEGLGWTVEDLAKDYGEDLFVRLFEGESATPHAFFVQAKATDNIARYRTKSGGFVFPIETGHLRHWVRFSEPVFLTLYDSESDQTYWVCVQSAVERKILTAQTYSKRNYRIILPCSNLLDSDGLLRMRGITKLRSELIKKEQQGAQILIELLGERFNFKVNAYEPTNEFMSFTTDSDAEYLFYGAAAERMKRYSEKAQMEPEELLTAAATAFYSSL